MSTETKSDRNFEKVLGCSRLREPHWQVKFFWKKNGKITDYHNLPIEQNS